MLMFNVALGGAAAADPLGLGAAIAGALASSASSCGPT
jgi:hypothetical protein